MKQSEQGQASTNLLADYPPSEPGGDAKTALTSILSSSDKEMHAGEIKHDSRPSL